MSSPQTDREEIVTLRLIFERNSRLNLEFLASLSKLIREHEENINPELLRRIVIAIPEELQGVGVERAETRKTPDTRDGGEEPIPPQPIPPLLVPPQPPLLVPPQPPSALGGKKQPVGGKSGKTQGRTSSKKGRKGTRKV
jgi:hypothetical protein